jgi:prevent-host-death family protein
MPVHIRPISDLRNKSLEISRLAHKSKDPVFITRNGREDLVVMSMAMWEELYVYPLLLEAEEDEVKGDKGRPFAEVMRELRKKHGLGEFKKRAAGKSPRTPGH